MPASPMTSPRKLLVVRPTLGQGGADRVTATLLRNMDPTRFDTSLLLFRREGPHLGDVPDEIPVRALGARSLWTAWWPLARHLRAQPPDVLFSTCSGTNVVACIASALAGRPARLVLSERNVLLRDQPFFKKWLMLLAKRVLYRSADTVTAVSRGVADDLIEKLSVSPDRVRVVYNPIVEPGIDELAVEPLDEPPYGGAEPILLAAGRLVPAKGFDVLLRAFAEITRRKDASLVILGDGPARRALRALAASLGIESRVFFPGFVKNPFRYMARSTVFVLSSRYEGLPGVLIQAMACGVPVVSTDCPAGPNEIITQGKDGILVPVGSAEALATEITRLLHDADLRQRLGAAGRERAQRFSVATVTDDYLRALTGGASFTTPDAHGSSRSTTG